MVTVRTSSASLKNLQRGVKYAKDRSSFRHRARRTRNAMTEVEKSLLRQKRRKNARDLSTALAEAQALVTGIARQLADRFKNHTPEYYHRLIMQQSRRTSHVRAVSKWNAFLSQETIRRNAERPAGAERKKISALTKEISRDWNRMSKAEQDRATSDKVMELYEQRANRAFGKHSVPVRAFGDARKTLIHIREDLIALHNRTDVEVLLIATRGNQQSYMNPFYFFTSDSVEDFVVSSTKGTVDEYSVSMEGFLLGKMSNARVFAQNARAYILGLKKQIGVIIDGKLQEASRRGIIRQMKYVNFQEITQAFGIVIQNWPFREPNKFKAPGNFSSRAELEILHTMWSSGKTKFRCLTDEEWDAWRLQPTNGLEWTTGFQPVSAPSSTTVPANTTATSAPSPRPPHDTNPPPEASSSSSDMPAGTTTPEAPPPSVVAGQKRPAEFINTVAPDEGSSLIITKRARKKRSDAGVPRGPRKKDAQPAASSAHGAGASSARVASSARAASSTLPTSATTTSPAHSAIPSAGSGSRTSSMGSPPSPSHAAGSATASTPPAGPAPSTSSTDPTPSTSPTDPAPSTSATSPAPSTSPMDPAPSTSATSPAPPTSSTDPAPPRSPTDPAPSTSPTDPAPSTLSTDPPPSTSPTSPAPSTSPTSPAPSTSPKDPAPSTSSGGPTTTPPAGSAPATSSTRLGAPSMGSNGATPSLDSPPPSLTPSMGSGGARPSSGASAMTPTSRAEATPPSTTAGAVSTNSMPSSSVAPAISRASGATSSPPTADPSSSSNLEEGVVPEEVADESGNPGPGRGRGRGRGGRRGRRRSRGRGRGRGGKPTVDGDI